MDVQNIGSNPLGDLGLIFEFGDGPLHHFGSQRVEHDELTGVKARSNLVIPGELTARLEPPNNLVAVRQLGYVVALIGVRLHRQDLAVDPEAVDAVIVVLRNLIGWSKKMQQSPKRIEDERVALFFKRLRFPIHPDFVRLHLGSFLDAASNSALHSSSRIPLINVQS